MCKRLYHLILLVLVLGLSLTGGLDAASLVGWWKLDSDLLDYSGLDNHGTAVGDPTFVAGTVGSGAIDLDGDDFVTIDGVADDITRNDVTLSAWVNLTAEKAYHSVLPVNTATGGNVMMIEIDNGEPYIYEMDGGQCYTGVQVIDGQWHLLTYTRSGDLGTLYIDGVPEGTHDAASFYFSVDDRWSIGQEWDGESPSDFTVGAVDDVRIYNRSLTTNQVEDLFNGILPTWSKAAYPVPADGADNVTAVLLEWEPGSTAVSHDVYFGISKTDVAAGAGGAFQGNLPAASFNPGTLLVGTTYYWRIDGKAADGTTTPGEIWSFTTAEHVNLDDFETYDDDWENFNRIFQVWIDGAGFTAPVVTPGNGSGSIVGTDAAPWVETAAELVHGGSQSIPMAYNNTAPPFYSEATRTFDEAQDFTANGLQGLTLWYRGQPAAVGSLSYDPPTQTYTVTGDGSGIAGTADEFHYAFKQLTGNGSITVKVESLTDTGPSARAGVMIRNTLDPNAAHGMVAVTPTGRVAFQFRPNTEQETGTTRTARDTVTGPHWVKVTRTGNLLSAEHSADGASWVPVQSADPDDPSAVSVIMGPTVYIGLAVTAGDPKAAAEATFSNLAIVGAPGPLTQSQDIGIGSNDPARLYVELEDSVGTADRVYHEDESDAVLGDDWQLWAIPLADFEAKGVDVTAVKKISLGAGDKDDPQPGGTGKLHFDDIQIVRRMPTTGRVVLFEEDFEGIELGPNVDEALAGDEVWTKTPPANWSIDDSGVPGAGDPANDGVTEWAGWSFADKVWWAQTAGDQERSQFVLANGTVAVADGDEWDDLPRAPGLMNTFLSTPQINVSAIQAGAGTLRLKFDSSWRREVTQTALVTVSFDGADPVEVMRWESEGGDPAYLKGDAVSETVTVDIDRPAAAKKMVVTFGYVDAGNNWWWAIDNVQVSGLPRERTTAFVEDFEGAVLGPNVEESCSGECDEVWTNVPPDGWTVDNSGVPGFGDPANDGVTEWAGWAFVKRDWWFVVDPQGRDAFQLGQGTIAVADPDEWDDDPHPEPISADPYDTWLTTPEIDVAGFEAGSVQLKFDSSWRPEFDGDYHQSGVVTASFDGGDEIEVLLWLSDTGDPSYKPAAENETVVFDLDAPAGAQSLVLTFGMFDAGNDWWWAVDNIEVSGLEREKVCVLDEDFEGLELGPSVDETHAPAADEAWTDTPPQGWIVDDSGVPGAGDPANDGATEWAGWSFTDKSWWEQIGQQRELFELGTGIVAVGDGDEWDDGPGASGLMDAVLTTPTLDISKIEAGSLELTFDSSWRREDTQTAVVVVQYDDAAAVEVLRWESEGGDPAYLKDDAVSETVTVALDNPDGAQTAVVTFGYLDAGNDWWWAIDNVRICGYPKEAEVIRVFSENFTSVTLIPSVEEAPPGDFWTDTPPAGWTVDDSGVPGTGDPATDGVTEWAGWAFADKDWWVQVAGDQERSQFLLGTGNVAIADPDEWDDAFHPEEPFNALMSTPAIDVSTVDAGTLELTFDSSWRDYADQTAVITVQYDGGEETTVLRWESGDGDPALFKDDMPNETVTVPLNNPAGAQSLVISFGLFNAGNDWWWAIDNLDVSGTSGGSPVTVLTEDFEGVPLGPSPEEAPPGNFWTDVPPAGWTVDDSGVPGAGDPANDGVTEWAGWSFASKNWWVQVAGDQERSAFASGSGVVAIADGDEWDDASHLPGLMNALMSTPAIDISQAAGGTLELSFDSSWRREVTQTASITVSYDGGAPIEVLRWESEGGDPAYLKNDATDEAVTVALNNPTGAGEMVITFGYLDAGNNWWWAIDNIVVQGLKKGSVPEPDELIPAAHPDYAEWVAVGKPDCWTGRQCHGDADNGSQGSAKTGLSYVATNDLNVLIAAWQVKEPPKGPGIGSVENGICADFARNQQGSAKTGVMRVSTDDLNILIAGWLVKEPPKGPGIPDDCNLLP